MKILLILILAMLPMVVDAKPPVVRELFDGRTTDGDSATYTFNQASGSVQMVARGTWDGATVTVYFSDDDGTTWIDIGGGVSCSANCAERIFESHGMQMKATVSSAGGSTDLDVNLYRMEK